MWNNIVQTGTSQMTIGRTRIACWIPKATKTHTDSAILIAFPLQQWLQERAPMLVARTLPVLFMYVLRRYKSLSNIAYLQCKSHRVHDSSLVYRDDKFFSPFVNRA